MRRAALATGGVGLSLFLTVTATFAACPREGGPLVPTMTTIAGRGAAGTDDGTALTAASFVEPAAVAVDRDGSILVADAGAHDIRRIAAGVVTTVAGLSKPGPSNEQRIGGYADGPAAQALFDRPDGIAVAKDGTIYVADSVNRAIRRIKDGIVTTLTRDLDFPKAVAIDDDGILYVADDGSGVRTVSTVDGSVSALDSISDPSDRSICGISVRGAGDHRTLAYTDATSIRVLQGKLHRDLKFSAIRDPYSDQRPVGPACAVQVIDKDSLIISNLLDNSVEFVRNALAGGVSSEPMVRMLANGRSPDGLALGGFADGPPSVARTDVPSGFALAPDGSVVVADSGNRRIRRESGIDVRASVSPGENGSLDIPPRTPSAYNVVFIGNSFAFTNSMWPDSIPGTIERTLTRDRAATGLTMCPAVVAYRLSGASIGDAADFITSYYGDGQADLVVFVIDAYNLQKDIQLLQKTAKGPIDTNSLFSPANYTTGWRSTIPRRLRSLKDALAKSGTTLAIVTIPDGRAVSPLENLRGGTLPTSLADLYTDDFPGLWTYKIATDYDRVFAASGVHEITTLDALIAAEEDDDRVPLFGTQDHHPTPAGNDVLGRTIARDLEQWKPWSHATK